MSRTTMYAFPETGPCWKTATFQNSWGSASRVWFSLCARYFGNENYWMSPENANRLWPLWKDSRLSECEKRVLLWTFDRALVRSTTFARMAEFLREFDCLCPVPQSHANHLQAIAVQLEECLANPKIVAAGWHQTSVSSNHWWVYTDFENGEGRPYDLSVDSNHFFVFDNLDVGADL
jgi:hypothetical protein